MPKNLIQGWDKQQSSEVMDYILETLSPTINVLESKKADRKDLQELAIAINALANQLSSKESPEVTTQALNLFAQHKAECRQEELVLAVNICAEKIDKLLNTVKALANKLDAEDVTSLDKDYLTLVNTQLN